MTEKNSLSGWSDIIEEQRKTAKSKNAPENMVIADNRFELDWSHTWTKEEAEEQLQPFKFNGPGWYISKSTKDGRIDTLLVVPDSIPCAESAEVASAEWKTRMESNTFAHTWPPGTKFRFYCYNGRNPAPLFCAIANAPTRLDER